MSTNTAFTCPHPLIDAVTYLVKNSPVFSEWVMVHLAHTMEPQEDRSAYVRKWANMAAEYAPKEAGK